MRARTVACVVGLVASVLAACDRRAAGGSSTAERDPASTLEATVDIGDGSGPYELSGIVGVATLADGRFVVGNGATNELRIFSAAGEHLATIGRTGGGPGEFYGLSWVGVAAGDTMLAYDLRSRQLSWFAPNGRYVRSMMIDTGVWSGAVIGRFADGSLLVTSNRYPAPRNRPAGLVVDSITLSRVSVDGARWQRLATLPSWQQFWTGRGAAGVGFGLPAYPKLQIVVCDSAIIAGYPDQPRVWYIDGDGRRVGDDSLPLVTHAIAADERSQMAARRIARASPDFKAPIEAAIEAGGNVLPQTYPPFVALGGDDSGVLWAGLAPAAMDAASRWVRIAPNGAVLDTVGLAPRARFAATTGDRIIVVSPDEDDVEHVLVYTRPQVARVGTTTGAPASRFRTVTGCHRGFFSALMS